MSRYFTNKNRVEKRVGKGVEKGWRESLSRWKCIVFLQSLRQLKSLFSISNIEAFVDLIDVGFERADFNKQLGCNFFVGFFLLQSPQKTSCCRLVRAFIFCCNADSCFCILASKDSFNFCSWIFTHKIAP